MKSSRVVLLLAAQLLAASALRRSSSKDKGDTTFIRRRRAKLHTQNIACPVIASMVTRGLLSPDSSGRVDQMGIIRGLMGLGNTQEMSGFQALGIVGFKSDDTYQVNRIRQSTPGALFFNLYNWNAQDSCTYQAPELATKVKCNANIEFQQHAFSTEIRDPKNGGTPESRFEDYFSRSGVLKTIPGVSGKAMTLGGMANLLAEIRVTGDKSGENSLKGRYNDFKGSLMEFFHPSAYRKDDYVSLSQWQALGAWGAMWAAFARSPATSGGEAYMKESDLKRMFVDSDFPSDWSPGQPGLFRQWGFRETFRVVADMDGSGAGDHWTQLVKGWFSPSQVGSNGTETQYQMAILGGIHAGNLDNKHRTYP